MTTTNPLPTFEVDRVAQAREAARERWQRPPAVLDQLKRLYGYTDEQIAYAVGRTQQEVQRKRKGHRRMTPEDVEVYAAFFKLDPAVFFLSPAEAARIALECDPELVAPSSA